MRCNKKILIVTTTVLFATGCLGLMGAMEYQNVKTEASDIEEDDIAKQVLMLQVKVWKVKHRQKRKKDG